MPARAIAHYVRLNLGQGAGKLLHRSLPILALALLVLSPGLFGSTTAEGEPGTASGGEEEAERSVGAEHEEGAEREEHYVGAATCRACHTVEGDHWSQTLHRRVFELGPRSDFEARSCETCHGPGTAHVSAPETPGAIRRFTRESPEAIDTLNEACLQCHRGGARIHWTGSTHEREDLACSDCHNPMASLSAGGLLREASVNRTCFSCHPQQRVEFRKRSHMPLHEGAIDCADCHNPHGSAADPLLAKISVNQVCTSCHPEKRGPFLWEHAPVRESCLSCHTPHGSNHEMLLTSPRPFLCQQCHSQIGFSHPNDLLTRDNVAGGGNPDLRLAVRSCTNCHAQIHGSNHPSGVRFHR